MPMTKAPGDADEARRWRDRDEARNRARGDAQHRRLALGHPLGEHPGQCGNGGRELRDDHRHAGAAVGGNCGTRVEAEPAHPQQRGADQRQRQVVRRHRLLAVTDPLAEHQRADQARDTGVDVHDRAAGEIEHALGRPVAGRLPHHVRDRRVDKERPQAHEPQHRRELHAIGEGAGDQRGRDDRERHLERHVDRLGNREPEVRHADLPGVLLEQHAVEEQSVEAADERAAGHERQAVTGDHPEHCDQAGDREALHHRRQHVLLAHHAAVEEREAREWSSATPARWR